MTKGSEGAAQCSAPVLLRIASVSSLGPDRFFDRFRRRKVTCENRRPVGWVRIELTSASV